MTTMFIFTLLAIILLTTNMAHIGAKSRAITSHLAEHTWDLLTQNPPEIHSIKTAQIEKRGDYDKL